MALFPEAPIGEHRMSGIVARSAGHAAAGMGAGAAQIEALERHPVSRRANHRPRAEQLVEAHLAVENVAADQPEAALEVERRMDLPAEDRLTEAWGVRVDGGDDLISRLLPLLVPAPPRTEVVPEVLTEQAR